jgi:hypothetical protein
MEVLNTTSPKASPLPVKERHSKVLPSSNANNAFIANAILVSTFSRKEHTKTYFSEVTILLSFNLAFAA